MMIFRAVVAVIALLAAATTSLAQPKEPIGRFVIDLRGASVGLPSAEGWTPTAPEGTEVPARSLGVEAGAHVFLVRTRAVTIGVGATFLTARGRTSPPAPEDGDPSAQPMTIPEVTTRLSSLVPQLSLNFGHSQGWSYLSVGLGRARVESEAVLPPGGLLTFTPRESGWTKALNYGGGARWFINRHVGVGLDLRWHKLSIVPTSATHPGAPRQSLVTAGAGIVVK
jgi:hypothetical protein